MVDPSGTPAASATDRWLTASIPSSAISRSVVCRSSSRRAEPCFRPAGAGGSGSVSAGLDGSVYICTVRSYRLWHRTRQHPGNRVDVLVIGGGIVGAAAALAAARRGQRVALVEAGSLAAARGSSKGTARIYAPAAYPDETYLELGLRALERWSELEAEAGETLLQRTGALSRGDFAEREMPALREAGVAADFLSPAAALDRFGVDLPDDAPLLHQPDAGVIHADRARRALLRIAAAAGAELHGMSGFAAWRSTATTSQSRPRAVTGSARRRSLRRGRGAATCSPLPGSTCN